MLWPERIAEEIAARGPLVRITVIRADGSTPREIGAVMLLTASGMDGTIGGGALEFEAIAHARGLLAGADGARAWLREMRDFALGPSLGQCCGGFVRVLFELLTPREQPILRALSAGASARTIIARPVVSGAPLQTTGADSQPLPAPVASALRRAGRQDGKPRAMLIPGRKGDPDWFAEPLIPPATPLMLYGAGHVARALVHVLRGLPFAVTWVDVDAERFPDFAPGAVAVQAVADPAAVAAQAPAQAFHIVMTHSHPLDLAICHTVLARGAFAHLGLIGSQTKRARFMKRLRELGIEEERLARLVCPIGVTGVEGKEPAVIAVAVAAELLQLARGKGNAARKPPIAGDADLQ